MIKNNFNIEEFKETIADLFEVNVSDLSDEYDLSVLIKYSLVLNFVEVFIIAVAPLISAIIEKCS